jgi:hypothetical protein
MMLRSKQDAKKKQKRNEVVEEVPKTQEVQLEPFFIDPELQ